MCEIGEFTTLDKISPESSFVFVFLNEGIFPQNSSSFLVYLKSAEAKVIAIFARYEFDLGRAYPADSILRGYIEVQVNVNSPILIVGNLNSSRRIIRVTPEEQLPEFEPYE